jgi:hypothetical protein
MEYEDFRKLKVDERIYYQGNPVKIDRKLEDENGYSITFIDRGIETLNLFWKDICGKCSLEKPAETFTKKFYIWAYKKSSERSWMLTESFLDVFGRNTSGRFYFNPEEWKKAEKRRFLSLEIAVEVDKKIWCQMESGDDRKTEE